MRRWITVGLESHFGSSVGSPAYWLDCLSASLDVPSNPFIEIPSVRTRSITTLKRGLYIPSGDIEMVLDKYKVGHFLRSMMGSYLCQGFTKVGTSTALDGAVNAGDTEITVVDASSFAVDALVQVGADWAEGTEVHKVEGVDTNNNEVTLIEALLHDHAGSVAVQEVSAPFTHLFAPAAFGDSLPSMEIRVVKDGIGGDQRFLGATVDSATFNFDMNDVAKVTFGIVAQKDEMAAHWPAPANGINTSGFGFDEIEYVKFDPDGAAAAVDFTGLTRSLAIQFSNGIQSEIGGRFGSRFPVELPTGALEVTARATLVFRNLAAYEWFWGQGSSPGEDTEPTRGNLEVKVESGVSPSESYFFTVYHAFLRSVSTRLVGPDTIVEEVEFVGTAGDAEEPFTIAHWNSSNHLYTVS